MKFIEIWILNPLKRSGGQLVALGGERLVFGLEVIFGPGFDTIIHLCYKCAVSHVLRVCAFGH